MIRAFARPAVLITFLFTFIAPVRSVSASPDAIAGLSQWLATPADIRQDLEKQPFAAVPLNKSETARARDLLWADHVAEIKKTRQKEWDEKAITIGSHTLKLLEKNFGTKPANGWDLFISMHGGGNADATVNDQQWQNQIRLYHPDHSLYIAPRAPTNTWNLWHEDHIDGLFERLIEDAIVLGRVNPDRVYLMGYSAGGDGVYQLGPRMADSFAAASMMGGHPNDASALGLRNLPFTIHVGALDDGYHRNAKAAEWATHLDDLQHDDPAGYVHSVKLHPARAHWMNLEDAVAVDWMQQYTRNALPPKVVWKQGNTVHDQFYWLATSPAEAKKGQLIVVARDHQSFDITAAESVSTLDILMNDAMLDLDAPVTISFKGKQVFKGTVPRTIARLQTTIANRGDPALIFPAAQTVTLSEN